MIYGIGFALQGKSAVGIKIDRFAVFPVGIDAEKCNILSTAIPDQPVVNDKCSNGKFIRDGQLYISHDGVIYTVGGLVFMRER